MSLFLFPFKDLSDDRPEPWVRRGGPVRCVERFGIVVQFHSDYTPVAVREPKVVGVEKWRLHVCVFTDHILREHMIKQTDAVRIINWDPVTARGIGYSYRRSGNLRRWRLSA